MLFYNPSIGKTFIDPEVTSHKSIGTFKSTEINKLYTSKITEDKTKRETVN